jgi:prepilin-type N-terminal cleavage/methylation domain-containing protein
VKKSSKFDIPFSKFRGSRRGGFTLIEIILVVVISLILMGVSLPYFAHAYKGSKLKAAARTVNRMARYARSMAIMRETTMSIVLNPETMEIYLGAVPSAVNTNTADGELDQDVLKRLGYVEDEDSSSKAAGIDKEVHRFLKDLHVRDFEKNWNDKDDGHQDFYMIDYYSDGQSEWFILELEDSRGSGIKLENDPVSGKIITEFTQ